MKRYYISHPFTGNEEANLADAGRIRAALKARYPNICFMNPLGMFGDGDADYCMALADALELLSCCEAIILCPGWEQSTGCRAEKAFAIHKGIKIHDLDEFIPAAQPMTNIELQIEVEQLNDGGQAEKSIQILRDEEVNYCPHCGGLMEWNVNGDYAKCHDCHLAFCVVRKSKLKGAEQ